MPKIIYTERDVDELERRGDREIVMTDNVYITDVARERAEKLGITLRASAAAAPPSTAPAPTQGESPESLVSRIKADVIARLGTNVDEALIDRIVRRVLDQLR